MRDQTTCTCNVIKPLGTSTPNCSRRSLGDCCPDVSIIEHECPPSPVLISHECSDLDEQIVLECSASGSTYSIHSEPNRTRPYETQHQLNSTYELAAKPNCDRSKACVSNKTCQSTVDLAKDWLSNKTCELKHKLEDLIFCPSKTCESKHVDFSDSCKLSQLDNTFECQSDSPSHAPSAKSDHHVNPCSAGKSFNYADMADKLCKVSKHVLDPAPDQTDKPSRHANVADNLFHHCKPISSSTSFRTQTPCKHCDITYKLCKQCKNVLDSAPCESNKSCKFVDIADKLCELCKIALDPVPCQPGDLCKHCDISKKLCKECKSILDSAPCPINKSCRNVSIADKVCDCSKHIVDSAPCQSVKPCKIIDVADKFCELCKLVVDPVPCQPVKSCRGNSPLFQAYKSSKHCDISKKLCKECKKIFDCQTNRSCKNIDIASKLCEHCRRIYESAPCRPIKSCLKHDIPLQLHEPCKPVLTPCKPVTSSKHCDISKKLCKEYKKIIDTTPCADITCRNLEIANRLCEHCRHIYETASYHSVKSGLKHDTADKSCEERSLITEPVLCNSDNPCKYCDISKKLCQECKHIFDSAPCADRTCRNLDIANKFCEQCRHIYETASCNSVKSWLKHDTADKSCEERSLITEPALCKSDNLCKCKNLDIADKLCEYCKQIYSVAPCRSIKLCPKHNNSKKSCEECPLIIEPASCKSDNPCKYCDIRKKLCKGCRHVFDTAPCADRTCRNLDIADKLCEHCKHIYDTSPCPSMMPWMKHFGNIDQSCEKCITCKYCDISKKLCKDCKRIFDSVPCVDRTCKNIDIANKLCEHCKSIYDTASCQLTKSCTKHVDIPHELCGQCEPGRVLCQSVILCTNCDITDKLCEECKHIFHSTPCADRSCKNVDIAKKLCEHCRHLYESAPCQKECPKQDDITKQSDSTLCQPAETSKQVQVPENGESPKAFEELFFNRQAAGCSSELWKCRKCAYALESQSATTLTSLEPNIKQEAKSTSFDIAKESISRSRGSSPGSPEGSCASARARFYQNKLLATLQILQNKEETVRVQAESIAVAESRIAALNARHTDLRREIDRKEKEIQGLRKGLKECRSCKLATCDVSLMAEETDEQKNIVTTLQNNLDIIEDLYRECFYESVKQESVIEMLRQSYLDVRYMEKDKSDRISNLHNVISNQKWSLDRCQDIATEVDNLKMEISNFINSSNNDSGMWEESVSGLHEDLQDIAAQLLTLRDLLTGDTCGLEQDNDRLKMEKKCLEDEVSTLRARISALEETLTQKDCLLDRQCQEQIEAKEREFENVREQLRVAMERAACCATLTQQLAETQAMLDEKTTVLSGVQAQCRAHEHTIQLMREQLATSQEVAKENENLRKELCCVSRRAARAQRRADETEGELARVAERCRRVEAACREKTSNALELERELDEAHARGAELCGEAGRVVRAVRGWAHRMREMHREQENQIKQKECRLRCLQNELHKRQMNICPRLWEQIEQGCSARQSVSAPSTSGSCSNSTSRKESSCPTVTFCMGERRHDGTGSSGSEIASCSSTLAPPCKVEMPSRSANVTASSTNVPSCSADRSPLLTKRTCKKKALACGFKRRYGWLGPFGAATQRDASAQHPTRCDAETHDQQHGVCTHTPHHAPESPGEEMFSRMESLSAALADGYRRWSRRAPT